MTFVDVPKMPNKALHCYLLMIIWILLLVAGVYKFLEPRQKLPEPAVSAELFHNLANDIKTRRIFKICNFPNEIADGDEGSNSRVLKQTLTLVWQVSSKARNGWWQESSFWLDTETEGHSSTSGISLQSIVAQKIQKNWSLTR